MVKFHLKELLKERNMLQKDLCELISARPSTISSLCNGTTLSIKIDLLDDICRALNCEASDLFEIV